MNSVAILAIILMFTGCCSNVVFLELIIRLDPGSGNLVTFAQFLFIAIEGFISTAKCGTQKPIIEMKAYWKLVGMFFIASVCNNYAFNFNVPMPLHMIFRSGSLVANMALGICILKRRYTMSKYVSVFMVTAGIILCTFESSNHLEKTSSSNGEEEMDHSIHWLGVGVFLLTVALFVSARMGIYQEELCTKYGKHPREALLYTTTMIPGPSCGVEHNTPTYPVTGLVVVLNHLLPLPGFILILPNIQNHFIIALDSPSLQVTSTLAIPIALVYQVGNMLTQRMCVGSVYVLTTECTSLTVTLLVTLRKFVSLIFSVIYFRNRFTLLHWLGTSCVFTGTLLFSGLCPVFSSREELKNNNVESDAESVPLVQAKS